MTSKIYTTFICCTLFALGFLAAPAGAQDFGGILSGSAPSLPSSGDTAGDDGKDPSDRFNSLKEQLGQRREAEKQDIDTLNSQLLQNQIDNIDNANGNTADPNISTGTDPQTSSAPADQTFSFILPDPSAQQNTNQGNADPTLGGLLAP